MLVRKPNLIYMPDKDQEIISLLGQLPRITLEEMGCIKLMNRIDTKYVCCKSQLVELLMLAQGHYYVQETLDTRLIPYVTTYYDTSDHHMYMMHHNKRARRCKVRVRTYVMSGDTFLEVKNKNNHLRTKKKRISVPSQDDFRMTEGASELVKRKTGIQLSDLTPTVRNRFERITLVNMAKTERLTIDLNIRFHSMETGNDHGTDQLVVIELKRDGNVFSPVVNMLHQLHINRSGFSKCCIGMALTDPSLKRNNFKKRLRYIERVNGRPFIDDVNRRILCM